MDYANLLKYAKLIQDAVLNENTAEALDKLAEYAKEGAALIRKYEGGGLMTASVGGSDNGDKQLEEIKCSTMECEQKCRQNHNQKATKSATAEGFTGQPQENKAIDPATVLFIFQTVIAIAEMIRKRRHPETT
jgi:hypothetical protein